MTETIDSQKEQLDISQIVMRSVHRSKETNELPDGVSIPAALASIARESGMPSTDVHVIGNTVFISHFNKEMTDASMRAFNIDSAMNFVENSFEYVEDLANSGIKRLTVDYKGDSITQVLMAVARKPVAKRLWGLQIFKTTDGGKRAYISLKATNS